MLFDLPNEILYHICLDARDIELWSMLAVFNESFRNYTIINRKPFINMFLECDTTDIDTTYTIFGKFHREDDLPAVITVSECEETHEWWINGNRHRDFDLPALIIFGDSGNRYEWYYHGKCHRADDRPAVISAECNEWFYCGMRHRDIDAPAEITTETQRWWRRGVLHRDDGPAEMHIKGGNKWYKNGHYIGNNATMIGFGEQNIKFNKTPLLTYEYNLYANA